MTISSITLFSLKITSALPSTYIWSSKRSLSLQDFRLPARDTVYLLYKNCEK